MTRATVHFHHPFLLPELAEPLPAGRYEVEYEEERLDGVSLTAWRTVRTTLRRIEVTNGLSFALNVGAEALKVAIACDADHPQYALAEPSVHAIPAAALVEPPVARLAGWRDLIIPPIIIPAAIGVAAIAAFILGPFQ
ncbi:hypothetical protein CHU95_03820 [Niveispirillum lacus]|uniref:Uncharacterized protein n=1 Tax=Niveispirillum lacus TaxID=1981099 RepID=A0A255Z5H7_9PROT|nr:hypothetical protein [Niveispirillum lacus]OYQ36699.1 hypothetical protein CHU95_03820 [Niveispirillum lacus]